MLKFLRDNARTRSMYNKYIPEKYRKGIARGVLKDLCIHWARETPLSDILNKAIRNKDNPEDIIEDTIDLLQNTVSYNVPLLLKPIIDIKNSNSSFLTCMQAGAYNDIAKTLIEMGVPRECAIHLNKTLFNGVKIEKNNAKENIRNILKKQIDTLPYWIKVQLDFLI